MSELTNEEREKENLVKEIERALHALVSTDGRSSFVFEL